MGRFQEHHRHDKEVYLTTTLSVLHGWDLKMQGAYTTISDKDIYTVPSKVKLVLNLGRIESVASTKPLAELLARLIDENMLQAIAAEHNKGRRLLVGTTQLDAQRLVIWNMGAIAAGIS